MTKNHKSRALKLWEKQGGLCWICGYPMLKPNFESNKAPGKWRVSVDHIGMKNGKPRPVLGAHQECNSARGHVQPCYMIEHLKYVTSKFQNANWVKSIFGKEVFEQLANPTRIP